MEDWIIRDLLLCRATYHQAKMIKFEQVMDSHNQDLLKTPHTSH